MAFGLKCVAIFFILTTVFLSGALVFLKGFLLSRTVVSTKSECEPEFAKVLSPPTHKHEIEGCWMHGRFQRAIVIIVDALRYDFLVYNISSRSTENGVPYLNKFPEIDYLLTRKPLHSRLYKFRADPPTTTMQRLKGLTTGSLPTFVDFSSNFQSYEITEDNWLHQLRLDDRKITFLGDDTWLGLFPRMFHKSFDFPSFDVKDLHTVDDGILQHLYPEIRSHDWDVIIAHFLGVDHCGHHYGPNHPSMGEKLSQMDKVIRSVTNLMKNDTVLFVMGDHGMTRTGDHGGDSEDELTAGMFIYSPSQLTSSPQNMIENNVVQTDFVPTLSLLLGLPIPFSNLGMAIPELFSHCPWWNTDSEIKRVFHKVKALRLNALQVNAYLDSYLQLSSDLPRMEMKSLKQSIKKWEEDLQSTISLVASGKGGSDTLRKLIELENSYISYLTSARKMCENVWAKFDLKMMFAGIATMALGVFLTMYFFFAIAEEADNRSTLLSSFIIFGSILHLAYLAFHIGVLPESVPPVMVFVISLILIFITFVSQKLNALVSLKYAFKFDNIVTTAVAVIGCLVYFSNSFVVHEDRVSLFLLQSLLFSLWLKILVTNYPVRSDTSKSLLNKTSKKVKSSFDILQFMTQPSLIGIAILFICSISLRFTSNFYACREEQQGCQDSFFLTPLSNLDSMSKNQRYLFSVFCLAVLVYSARYWLKYYGNLNGTQASAICLSYAPNIAAICTCLHWAFQTLPQSMLDKIPNWQQALLAQIVYVAILISLTSIITSPLLIYALPTRQESSVNTSKGLIPSLYNQIKLQMPYDGEKPPLVYGLGSVYSATIVAICLVLSILLCLLLNDSAAPSILYASLSFYLILEMYSVTILTKQKQGTSEDSSWQDQAWTSIVFVSVLSTAFFYATGHQATITNIHMEAAFVGFYGDFSTFILPGFLVWTNTFASHIFFGMASPFFVFWPFLSSALVKQMMREQRAKRDPEGAWKGDFSLFNDGIQLRKKLFQLLSGILLIFGLKMLAAACAATIHRRHLMVWKIFAPRLIYEASMFTTISVCLGLSFLFILRIDTALSKFVKTLPTGREIPQDKIN